MGRTKKKGEGGGEEAGQDPQPRARELKQRRDSQIWGDPLSNREINWDRREAFEVVKRGWGGWSVAGRIEWEIHRRSVPQPYVPWTGTCVHRCARGLGAGAWGLENRPGARTTVGCREMGRRKSTAGNAYRGRLTSMEVGHYCWVTQRERSHYCSLFLPTCWPLLTNNKRRPLSVTPHVPHAKSQKRPSLGPYILHPWLQASLCIWCPQGSCDPSSHTTSAPWPHWGRPKNSKAASGPDSCGWTTRRGGDKTKAEPQGWGD